MVMPDGIFPKKCWIAGVPKLRCQQSNLVETFAGIAPFLFFKLDELVNL